MTVQELLAAHTPAVRDLVYSLRKIVRDTIPDVEERVYPGWHGIGFHHMSAGYFCGVFPQEDRVKLFFEHGKILPDPDQLFTGFGKQTGHILIRTKKDIRVHSLKRLLNESVELGQSPIAGK